MGIRMTGLVSGMDTESIIKELMAAKRTKVTKIENKQTKLEWTQDKWKELNTKIYKLYTDSVSNMRLQGSYKTQAATVSDTTKASVKASASAPEGASTLEITKLANSQYVTGSQISTGGLTTTSTLVGALGMTDGTVINITSGTGESAKTAVLDINSKTTIADFVQKCKDVGLSASYDTVQGRFFIGSKYSGESNAYTITSSTLSGTSDTTSRDNIRALVNYDTIASAEKSSVDLALNNLQGASSTEIQTIIDSYDETTATADQKSWYSSITTLTTALEKAVAVDAKAYATAEVKAGIKSALLDTNTPGTTFGGKDYTGIYSEMSTSTWSSLQSTYSDPTVSLDTAKAAFDKSNTEGAVLTDEEKTLAALYKTYETNLGEKVDALVEADAKSAANVEAITARTAILIESGDGTEFSSLTEQKNALMTNIKAYSDITMTEGDATSSSLTKLGLGEINSSLLTDGQETGTYGGMVIVKASDSEIKLNGAILTGTTNSIQANGLTINLQDKTELGKPITINVSKDTKATYDMIKTFVTDYNKILKEMNDLYYAKTAKGYDPLTDEEKETMTDDQIEKWETKIKDSLLRRDSTLGDLITSMKSTLGSHVEVDGKNYSLSTYGIMTSIDYTEKGLLHIYGDKSDSTYADQMDKLTAALVADPDTVAEVMAGIATKLHETMADKMKSTTLSSALTFYNDKQMTKQVTSYKKDISTWEDRLKEMEDRYYKQFSAMETALAKMNSQQSSLSNMMGS